MKKFIILVSLATIPLACQKQEPIPSTVDSATGQTTFSWSQGSVDIESAVATQETWDQAARKILLTSGAKHRFPQSEDQVNQASFVRTDISKSGLRTVTYQQELLGIPVFNSKIAVAFDAKGRHLASSGAFLKAPAKLEAEAEQFAAFSQRQLEQQFNRLVSSQRIELVESPLKIEALWMPAQENLVPAIAAEVYGEDGNLSKLILDAQSGKVLETISMTIEDSWQKPGSIR